MMAKPEFLGLLWQPSIHLARHLPASPRKGWCLSQTGSGASEGWWLCHIQSSSWNAWDLIKSLGYSRCSITLLNKELYKEFINFAVSLFVSTNMHCIPNSLGAVLDVEDTEVNKTDKAPGFMEVKFWGRQTINMSDSVFDVWLLTAFKPQPSLFPSVPPLDKWVRKSGHSLPCSDHRNPSDAGV